MPEKGLMYDKNKQKSPKTTFVMAGYGQFW